MVVSIFVLVFLFAFSRFYWEPFPSLVIKYDLCYGYFIDALYYIKKLPYMSVVISYLIFINYFNARICLTLLWDIYVSMFKTQKKTILLDWLTFFPTSPLQNVSTGGLKEWKRKRMIFPILASCYGAGLVQMYVILFAMHHASTSCLSNSRVGVWFPPSLKVAHNFIPQWDCSLLGSQVTESPIALKSIYTMVET